MKMIREENFDVNLRMKKFGKIGGIWICEKCQYEENSFLYNWEYHIHEICPKCSEGRMIEDESRRNKPIPMNFIDRNKEKNCMSNLSNIDQASVLLDEKDPY